MIQFEGKGISHDPETGEWSIDLPEFAGAKRGKSGEEDCRLALAGILSDLMDHRGDFGLFVHMDGTCPYLAEVVQHA